MKMEYFGLSTALDLRIRSTSAQRSPIRRCRADTPGFFELGEWAGAKADGVSLETVRRTLADIRGSLTP